jgi:superfamily I DNA/RNA helicase
MSVLTPDQQAVVDAPMVPLSVIACAGSGKTKTAVHRLVQMRRNLGSARGRVALLSFSNVAVDTFHKAYDGLAGSLPSGAGRSRVDIDTLDGFLTTNIIRPHGHRIMRSVRPSFLVTGNEAFLERFTFSTSSFRQPTKKLQFALKDGEHVFFHVYKDQTEVVNPCEARKLIAELGRTGAYTHDLGRYWAYRALKERPRLLAVVARRYPYIMVDEAQDIGSVHQAILELLIGAGSCVTLIGDPNQGIYEFTGADGKFLVNYHQRPNVQQHSLRRNFRSAPCIVDLANSLCGRDDAAERPAPSTPHGTFFLGYKRSQHFQLMAAFHKALAAAGADVNRSSVLCRGKGLAERLRGDSSVGRGLVTTLATAAVLRDRRKDYLKAFQNVVVAVVALLHEPPDGLVSQITRYSSHPEDRELRKAIWAFTRDTDNGLPSSSLVANEQWHSLLLARMKVLLSRIETNFGLKSIKNIGHKLAKTKLPDVPLTSSDDLSNTNGAALRVNTVHKVKGESLDAVLYITITEHAQELLQGMETEVGRIGYVAATRARDLLWIAVPDSSLDELRPTLLAKGLKEVRLEPAPRKKAGKE